jgi:RNA polymerase-binding transcription factor DksA
MAKKAQKAKAVKKAVKPAKKAATKAAKKAQKPAAKKAAAKKPKAAKAVKPLLKKAAKKAAAKPAKKAVAQKPVKKAAPSKTVGKKVATSKTSKPAKKVVVKAVKKVTPKVPAKPAKKVTPKAPIKPAAKSQPAKKAAAPAKETAKPKQKAGIVKTIATAVKNIFGKSDVKNSSSRKEAVKPTPAQAASKKSAAPVQKREEKREVKPEVKVDAEMEKKKQDNSAKPALGKGRPTQPKPQVNSDNRTRYSDAELQEFKELILKKLEEAKKDYELLKSTLSHKDDHGTDDTSPTFKLLEDGSDVLSKEETAHLAARQEKFIQALQNALIRIENKTYGICRVSGKLISKERLRSVPHATLSIDAKLEQNA